MAPSKRNRTSAADGRSHKKHDPTEISLSGKGPGRPPNREAPPGKSDRPEKQRRSVATAANSYLSKIKSWVSHLAIKSGELINFQTARILLLSMISTAIATPLAWVNKLPVMTPVFQAVHEVTKVSVSKLKNLFENTAMEDMDGEQVLRVPVADRSTETPSVRMDLRGCTPRHLQAISDFIDACHSKAGAGKVMPTSFPPSTPSLNPPHRPAN